MATDFTHAVRAAELALTIPLLPAGGKVLELGAGDGWQANELRRRGFTVTGIDTQPHADSRSLFPVERYDGISIPYPDAYFDAVYSSNVLEHVEQFEKVQAELTRVLRPNGIAVHCVPSTTWRLWTLLGHPIYAARWGIRLLLRQHGKAPAEHRHRSHPPRSYRLIRLIRLGLWPERHGEHGSAVSELWIFNRLGWSRRFRETSWQIVSMHPTRLFYSGNELFGLRLSVTARTRLSAFLGSSTLLYVLSPSSAPERSI